jgi:hypothetical protein
MTKFAFCWILSLAVSLNTTAQNDSLFKPWYKNHLKHLI